MAQSRRSFARRVKLKSKGLRRKVYGEQTVFSEPQKIFVRDYTTPSEEKKKQYRRNPNAKQVRVIYHEI